MADTTRTLKARFSLDTSDAPAGAKRIRAAMQDVSADVNKANAQTRIFASSLSKDLSNSAAASSASVERLRDRIDSMLVKLEKTGRGSTDAANQLRAMRSRIDENAASLGLSAVQTEKNTGLVGKFQEKLEGIGPVGARFSKSLEGMGASASIFALGPLAVVATALAAGIKGTVDLAQSASDLNEQISRSQVVFGSASGKIVNFAEAADKNLGLSETAALSAAGAFGGLFHNAGLSDQAVAKSSTTLVALSGDLASFMNLEGGSAEAADKLRMGLTGQLDVLRDLGVFISDVDVTNEALRMGLAKQASQVTESQKVIARYNLILAQTSQAQGDFARTSDQAANMQRQVGAEAENAKTQIGTALLPFYRLWLLEIEQIVHGLVDIEQGVGRFNQVLREIPMGETIKNFEDWGGQLLNVIGNQHKASTEATQYGSAQAKATDITKSATQQQKEYNDALQNTNNLLFGTFNADIQYQQSILATKDSVAAYTQAQKDLNDAIRIYGPRSQQAKDAQEALDKAQLDVRSSALSEAQAHVQAGQAAADLNGKTYGARDALVAERDSLQAVANQLAPGSAVRVNLQQYIDQLNNRIPREIVTTVRFREIGSAAGGPQEARASGGSVLPGRIYTVGEAGPEKLVMGSVGGYVIPNQGGGTAPAAPVTINIYDATNPQVVAMAVERRLSRLFA